MHKINIAQKCFFSKRCQVFMVQTSLPCYYGPPTTKTKPTSLLAIFCIILSYFKIKIKKENAWIMVAWPPSMTHFKESSFFLQELKSKTRALNGVKLGQQFKDF